MTENTGTKAEILAANYLLERGYAILDRNFRKPWGELDIVAKRGAVIIFAEVKAAKNPSQGFEPELHMNRQKIIKLIRTARTYLAQKGYGSDQEWQIDLVSVTFDSQKASPDIRHYENIEIPTRS